VATTGVAIVSADLGWLFGALLFWVFGILAYLGMTSLIVWRTVHERLDRDGFEPDSWILMGGLAIATLAGDHIHRIWPVAAVELVTEVTWVLATLWIAPLVFFGVRRLRRHAELLRLPSAWWAMVFPVGMYSSATYAMAAEIDRPWLRMVSEGFFWAALLAWLTVAGALLLRFVESQRR
jgi:tellurite resistance protein TehA-like permease